MAISPGADIREYITDTAREEGKLPRISRKSRRLLNEETGIHVPANSGSRSTALHHGIHASSFKVLTSTRSTCPRCMKSAIEAS